MVPSIRNLFSYAWANMVAALGTTTLSILLFSFAIPLLVFTTTVAVGWREQRRAGKSVKDIIKGSFLSWPTIIPSTVYIVAWVGLLGWYLLNTGYKDHVALLGRVRTLVNENKTLKSSNDTLKNENQELKSAAPKIITRTLPAPPAEPKNSLRRRTMQLADEVEKYLLMRANNPDQPPVAIPNSSNPHPSEEEKKAIARYQQYQQETSDYYFAHYRDRMIGIIKEYDAKGVKTGYLESNVRQFVPYVPMPGSVAEGACMDTLCQFRELAYHVDGEGNLIVITP